MLLVIILVGCCYVFYRNFLCYDCLKSGQRLLMIRGHLLHAQIVCLSDVYDNLRLNDFIQMFLYKRT